MRLEFILGIAFLTLALSSSAFGVDVTGRVFLDRNSNGQMDRGEPGVDGIMVSDGENVVRTDAKGQFSLQFETRTPRSVFVTRPTGYVLTTPWYVAFQPPEPVDLTQLSERAGSSTARYQWPKHNANQLLDQSGNQIHSELVFSDPTKSTDDDGLHFTAPDDRIRVPYASVPVQSQGMIRLQFKFDSLDDDQTLFRVYTLGDGLVLKNKNGSLRFSYYHRGTQAWHTIETPAKSIVANQWHSVVAYWDTKSTLALLLDGKPISPKPIFLDSDFRTDGFMTVGNNRIGDRAFHGSLKSFEYWQNPLKKSNEPDGTATDSHVVLFGIAPDANKANQPGADFTIFGGSDIQYDLVNNEEELRYDWATMESLAKSYPIAFATWAGDLTVFGRMENLLLLRDVEETLSYPTYNSFGGHDGIEGGPTVQNYEKAFGPAAYSWDYAGRHFIAYVSEPSFMTPASILEPRQDAWLRNDLAAIKPGTDIFFVTHRPESTQEMLNEVPKTHNVVGVLRGHYHQTYTYRSSLNNIPVISSAPIRQRQAGAFTKQPRLLHFSGDNVTSQIVFLGQDQRTEFVWPQPDASISASAPLTILINTYNSSSIIQNVSYTLVGPQGPVLENGKMTQQSRWSWQADGKPLHLSPGAYTLAIHITDDQDQHWKSQTNFTTSSDPYPQAELGKNWLTHFGPQADARVTDATPSAHLRMLWSSPVASKNSGTVWFANPLVRGNVVYASVRDDNVDSPNGGIVAFDAMTGKQLWKINIGSIIHTPAIVGSHLVAVNSTGLVHGIDLETHQILWTFDLYQGANFDNRYAAAPVTATDDSVIVGADTTPFFCLDINTGKPNWSWKLKSVVHGMISSAFVAGNRAYIGDQQHLYALDLSSGSLVWEFPLGYRQRVFGTPSVYNDRLYFNQHGRISAFDISNDQCQRLWQVGSSMYKFTMPVVHGDKLYYSGLGELHARNIDTGKSVWRIDTTAKHNVGKYQEFMDASAHTIAGQYDYVGSDNGVFYVLELDTGKIASTFKIGTPIKSSAAISGNIIFIGGTDGNLYALSPGLTLND